MSKLYFKIAALFALAVLVLVAAASTEVPAQTPAANPAATRILQRMTEYLGSLGQFSVHTQNTLEDMLDSGHRVDYDVSAKVIISRPNKLQVERRGDLIDQDFYYDGKTLTLYNPSDKVYATVPAPGTMEGMLDFARASLGLMIPAADLPFLPVQLVPEAEAIFGVRRRAWRRGVIVGSTMGAASEAAAMSHQQAAPAQPQDAPAAPAAPPPAASGKPLPLGTVVSALPGGCTSTPVGGVEYYYCGGNFYRAVFQGNSLVYVTTQPK